MYKRIGATVVCTALVLSLTACGTNYNNRDNVRNDRVRTNSTHNGYNGYINGNATNNGYTTNQLGDGRNMHNNATRNDMNNNVTRNGNGYNTMSNGGQMNNQQNRLVERVRSINGVNDATVFVNGKDIIVGLEVNNVGQKKQVEQKVRQVLEKDNHGYTVHVTSERAIHDRIRSISGQMQPMDGHPMRDMAHDIGQLLKDMGRTVTEPLR